MTAVSHVIGIAYHVISFAHVTSSGAAYDRATSFVLVIVCFPWKKFIKYMYVYNMCTLRVKMHVQFIMYEFCGTTYFTNPYFFSCLFATLA